MADVEQPPPRSPKRDFDLLDDETTTPSKRPRQAYQRHHVLQYAQQSVPTSEPAFIQVESVDKLLAESIKLICEEEALAQEVSHPVIESLALEAFRNAVEEFILKICSHVRRSMTAARRTVPIAPDFESAIRALDLPRPDSQLLPYRTKSDINQPLLPTPPPDSPFHDNVKFPASFLGDELGGQSGLKRFAFNTTSLPPLPSAHTYKDTAVFSQRETDSRKIRELATEEGKLGEQALRKLAGAIRLDAAHPVVAETKKKADPPPRLSRRRRKPELSEEAVFEETMRDLLKGEPQGFELGPIVTSEKAYRMPDDGRAKRRPGAAVKGKEGAVALSQPPAAGPPALPDYMDL